MKLNRKIDLMLAAAFLAMLLLFGCSENSSTPSKKSNEMEVTLVIEFPSLSTSQTRGISSTDENKMAQVDVLVFKVVAGVEKFFYHTHAITENIDNGQGTLKVLLRKSVGNEKHRIVILANLRQAVLDAKSGFVEGMVKDDLLKLITFKSDTKWNTTSSSDFTPLPMWGETAGTHVITASTNSTSIGKIYMLRGIARIDVILNVDVDGDPQGLGTEFVLTDVNVYKSRNQGAAVPSAVTTTIENGKTKITVNGPTIPASAGYNATSAWSYDAPSVVGAFIREIYVAENNNATETDDRNRTCIVVGGYYTAPGGTLNTTVKTWYRIDFYKRSGQPNERLDVLRNHRYRVNITSVGGAGYVDTETAYESAPVNMDTEVVVWDESALNDATSDGQYQLIVDENRFEFFKEGREQKLEVYTDHPKGWEVSDDDRLSWVRLDPYKHTTGGVKTTVTITVDPIPATELDPTFTNEGYFVITAGKMKKKIYVTQINQPELTLEVTPTQLLFRKSGSLAKVIDVKTYPEDVTRYFLYGQTEITWEISPGADDIHGETSYQFKPKVNNTGKILDASVIIEIRDPATGAMAFKSITIRQLTSDLLFEITGNHALYTAAGGAMEFTVYSPEAPWQLITDGMPNPGGMLSGYDNTEQPATPIAVDYGFMLAGNPTFSPRTAKFFATSSDADFPRREIDIVQGVVNPYINVTNPADHILDAGATIGVAAPITFNTNTSWSWSPGLNFADVCDAASTGGFVAETEYQGGTDAITPQEITQQFVFLGTYKTGEAAKVDGGSAIQSVVTYQTLNHSPAAATSKQVIMRRTVRPMIESPELVSPGNGTTVVAKAFDATITLNTNVGTVGFACTAPGDNETGALRTAVTLTRNPTVGWGTSTATMLIPENSSWIADRSIYMKYCTVNKTDFTEIKDARVIQKARNLTASTVTPTGNIPGAGGTYTMATHTTSSTPDFRIKVLYGNNINLVETLAGPVGSRTVVVPQNQSWSNRTIIFEYAREGGGGWHRPTNNAVRTQVAGYTLSATVATGTIPHNGGSWGVTTTTNAAGNYYIRAMVGTTQVGINTVSGSGLKYLTVGKNTVDATRTVTFQYGDATSGIWKDIGGSARTQAEAPYVLWKDMYLDKYWNAPIRSRIDAAAICRDKGGRMTTVAEATIMWGYYGGVPNVADWFQSSSNSAWIWTDVALVSWHYKIGDFPNPDYYERRINYTETGGLIVFRCVYPK